MSCLEVKVQLVQQGHAVQQERDVRLYTWQDLLFHRKPISA